MAGNSSSSSSGSGGFCGLLTIVFITLKLTHFIDWPWWWVLSPIWITLAVIAVFMAIVGVIAVVMAYRT